MQLSFDQHKHPSPKPTLLLRAYVYMEREYFIKDFRLTAADTRASADSKFQSYHIGFHGPNANFPFHHAPGKWRSRRLRRIGPRDGPLTHKLHMLTHVWHYCQDCKSREVDNIALRSLPINKSILSKPKRCSGWFSKCHRYTTNTPTSNVSTFYKNFSNKFRPSLFGKESMAAIEIERKDESPTSESKSI